MKTLQIKSGTREEIIAELRSKIKGVIKDITNAATAFGEVGEKFSPFDYKDGELYEMESNTIEQQMDDCIKDGSPIVFVTLAGNKGVGTYREKFFVTDWGQVRTDKMLEEIDNDELRNKKLDRLRWLLKMEDNSKELWDKIVKAMAEFDGVALKF